MLNHNSTQKSCNPFRGDIKKIIELNESFEIDGPFLKCEYIRYVPPFSATSKENIFEIFIDLPREDSVFYPKSSI